LETLAVLIYLNQQTEAVIDGKLNFHSFGNRTAVLLLGSRDQSTQHVSLNINTILEKCEKRYDLIVKFYAGLSECAHPNHEGLIMGYSRPDRAQMIENFGNRWTEMYGETHETGIHIVAQMFEHEYNDVWPQTFNRLEGWLAANDAHLEATKNDPL
jgi:hypothetical protein